MSSLPELERVRHITLTPGMKLIVMSDMHRGDGSGADDFAKNSLIYRCALGHYLEEGFTYIELGDAEELWENDNFDQIYITHTLVYELLARFHDRIRRGPVSEGVGNHDLYWKDHEAVYRTLFPGIEIHEGISWRLPRKWNAEQAGNQAQESGVGEGEGAGGCCTRRAAAGGELLLIHGHRQTRSAVVRARWSANFLSIISGRISSAGVKDPTRAALNPGLATSDRPSRMGKQQ
jgi:hypothetical protein